MKGYFVHSPRDVLLFIERYYNQHRMMPTVRDIQRGLSMSSTSVVAWHLRRLEEQGYITRGKRYAPRSIRLTRRLLDLTT